MLWFASQPSTQSVARSKTPTRAKTPPKTVEKKQEAKRAPVITDEDLENPDNVMKLVSNDVLEWELKRCAARLAQPPSGEDEDEGERWDAEDRKLNLETALETLGVLVQTGKLSLEGYLERLEAGITRDKALFGLLMKKGDKDNAKYVAERCQIMKKELADARANLC